MALRKKQEKRRLSGRTNRETHVCLFPLHMKCGYLHYVLGHSRHVLGQDDDHGSS